VGDPVPNGQTQSAPESRPRPRAHGIALSADERDHAQRFLQALTLTLMPAAMIIGMLLMPWWLKPTAPLSTFTFQAGTWVFLTTLVVYFINRRGHYVVGSHLFVAELLIAPVWAAFDRTEMLVFLFVGVLVATVLLPLRGAVIAGVAAVAAHAVVLLRPGYSPLDIAFPFCVNSLQTALVIVVRAAHWRLEQSRLRALEESERWFATTLSSIGDAVLTCDTDGRVTFINPVAAQLTGWSSEEAEGQRVEDVFRVENEQTGAPAESPVHKVLRERRVVGLANHTALVTRQGQRRPINDSGAPILSDTGLHGVVLVFRDMSQERALEQQLEQAARLESLGRLAGGVAHDFNNLLTVIGGGVELALLQISEADPARVDLDEVFAATERAVGLTRQLLAFSRRQVLQPRVIELNAAVTGVARILHRMLGDNVEIRTEFDTETGRVLVDPVQLDQVITNLAINGADAMPEGGCLTLATDVVTLAAQDTTGTPAGTFVRLRVTDTGTGMDSLTRARAFEPFFSTKEPGRGTGLGLATVHGIVQQSGGSVSIDTQLGKGTTFTVLLPSTARLDEAAGTKAPPSSTRSQRALRTILIVEDDPAVRRFAERVLVSLGYTPLVAASGEEALLLASEHLDRIHLLITDIVMPRMTGPEVAERLRAQAPELPVLFISGYADEVVARHGMTEEDGQFLEKPFTRAALAIKVKAALAIYRA
jgi:two-component system, cell cycle sensor histidine kinase and response regulator CckA